MKKIEFKDAVSKLGLELNDEQLIQYDKYHMLLAKWNEVMNLTGITDEEGVYEKHFYDSLLSIKEFKYKGRLADVGSGAGFPGLVLKIAYPELDVVLIEPINKRCNFLNAVIDELGLKKIEVVNMRSEDYVKINRETFDIVTARAVSNLNILSELCVPLLKVNGTFVILRGASGEEEIKAASSAFKILNMKEDKVVKMSLSDDSKRIIGYYSKTKITDKKYPRNYGMIKKKPL